MRVFALIACLLAGCAVSNTRYRVVCKNSPANPAYPAPIVSCPCSREKIVVTKKTNLGIQTFEVETCDNHRVEKWKRIRPQR